MKLLHEEPLAEYTTYRIGGRAQELYVIESLKDLERVFQDDTRVPESFYVIGRGSNLLIAEGLLTGPFLHLGGDFTEVEFRDTTLRTGAGVPLPQLAIRAAERGLSGLEWAAGIPGSLGGAIAMNAGAFDQTISEYIRWIRYVDQEGNLRQTSPDEASFGYRWCSLRGHALIVEAELQLEEGTSGEALARTRELLQVRHRGQPVGAHSAGCVFQNPEDDSAGRLIDVAGLKGTSEGAVCVSQKHANYFINRGGARRVDVMRLIDRVREHILRTFDVELELEVQLVND